MESRDLPSLIQGIALHLYNSIQNVDAILSSYIFVARCDSQALGQETPAVQRRLQA